ncbi:MAG: hypothetical protein KGL92_07350 [Gammaproteobacteria bacterium]|nr:hypothetical protein [Gammaproteobacteria bacterium]MDE2348300.1 hypothetical protein [Gammaproteobacteria bacterium]
MTIRRTLIFVCLAALTGGCHALRENCNAVQEYQVAREAPPLRVPVGMDSPDVEDVLVIPAAPAVAPPPRGPKDACLDAPPKYRDAPRGVAAGG